MILQKTNIADKLRGLKNDAATAEKILHDVYTILHKTKEKKDTIEQRLSTSKNIESNDFIFDELESDRIFHIGQIKDICIDYRLRFLNSKYFKGQIPKEAFEEIERLEQLHRTELNGFKIMAPSKLFKLEDKDDPLLFAPIGNGYFYLIHKWGNDLVPLRKALVWPFKNIVNLALTTLVISFFATLMVPSGLFSKTNTAAEFWMIFFFMFKCIGAIVIYYGFAMGKNFNPVIWNSKYYNA